MKLSQNLKIKPKTLGQALRIDGITPAAVYILLSHVKRKSIKHGPVDPKIIKKIYLPNVSRETLMGLKTIRSQF